MKGTELLKILPVSGIKKKVMFCLEVSLLFLSVPNRTI